MPRVIPFSLAIVLFAFHSSYSCAQSPRTQEHRFSDLFKLTVERSNGEPYLTMQPDTTNAKQVYGPIGSAVYFLHDHLFENHAAATLHHTELLALHPDTAAIQQRFRELLDTDTAFQRIYMPSLRREMVAPLAMDSALNIAAHYFYLHRDKSDKKVNMHVCIGINKVMAMSKSPAHPYYSAFGYMVIWDNENKMAFGIKAIEPFRKELKDDPSDARVLELEQHVYRQVAQDQDLKQAILDAYQRKAQYLNFELVY